MRWIDAIGANFDFLALMPLECHFEYNFYRSLVVRTITPLLILSGLLSASALAARRHAQTGRAEWQKLAGHCSTACFLLIFFIYPSVSSKIFQTFTCDSLDDELDGSDRWLRADLSIDCNGPERAGYIAFATIMVFVYPLGTPFLYWLVLCRWHREQLEAQAAMEQAAASEARDCPPLRSARLCTHSPSS